MTFERLSIFALAALLAACAEPQPKEMDFSPSELRVVSGRAMGSTWSVRFVTDQKQAGKSRIRDSIAGRLETIESQMSTWRTNSVISRFNNSTNLTWFHVPPEMFAVIRTSMEISAKTGGAFDITVQPLVKLWGFGGNEPPAHMEIAKIEKVHATVGMDKLLIRANPPAIRKTRPKLQIDLSGIAKGYAVDEVARILDGYGFKQYLIEIGGELKSRGESPKGHPWRVGIERPEPGKYQIVNAIELTDRAIATSGDYRNFRELGTRSYSHIMNPMTGRPRVLRNTAVSVLHDSCMIADAWATALAVLNFPESIRFSEASGIACQVILKTDTEVTIHPNRHWR